MILWIYNESRGVISLDYIVKFRNYYKSVDISFLDNAIISWIFRDLRRLTKIYPDSHRDLELTYQFELEISKLNTIK